jgi:hypothetical protein
MPFSLDAVTLLRLAVAVANRSAVLACRRRAAWQHQPRICTTMPPRSSCVHIASLVHGCTVTKHDVFVYLAAKVLITKCLRARFCFYGRRQFSATGLVNTLSSCFAPFHVQVCLSGQPARISRLHCSSNLRTYKQTPSLRIS